MSKRLARQKRKGSIKTTVHRKPPFDDSEFRLWALRLLVPFGLYKEFVQDKQVLDDDVARFVGLGDDVDAKDPPPTFDRLAVINRLQESWEHAERIAEVPPPLTEEIETLRRLAKMLGLTHTDIEIIRFRMATDRCKELRNLLFLLARKTNRSTTEILAVCLNRPESNIEAALAFNGTLLTTGVIEVDPGRSWFNDRITLLGCLVDELHFKHDDPITYFRDRVLKAPAPRLTVEHFPHMSRDHEILRQYLTESMGKRQIGVNVLVHGQPGTGKTEFIRLLATDLGAKLYEVAATRSNGSELGSWERFRAYRLSQALLKNSSGTLILFDEVEDVFQESEKGKRAEANKSGRKAWVNKILESNPVPAFWVSNNIHVIDRAYLRRFDYILEMKIPPRSIRSRILDEYLGDLPVSEEWKQHMAEHEDLMPAVVERAAKVVRSAIAPLREEAERSLAKVIGNTLEVMGLSREPRSATSLKGYRLDAINADCDMVDLQTNLKTQRRGRICLYGPPGTGKTAYGKHVAAKLDLPLLLRRASDIISPWLGMTEQNLARMFRQAQEEEAVLLLDEADSFLQDRQGAQRSWEVTEVNEMLTQMESFEGIFIASTNLMTSLDAAALRRFDLKIRFDYLKPEQAWALFIDTRHRLGINDEYTDVQPSLARLNSLTPGDFANIVRQARLVPVLSSVALLGRLRAECEMKPEGKRQSIGFT